MRPSDGVPSDGAPRDAESDAATETAVDAALARQRAALRNALSRAEASEAAAAALSDAVARLEKRWTLSQKPFDEVAAAIEASVMSKVAQLTNRNEALERRLKNARFVAEASEEVASNAVVKQIAAEREATENARHVRRLVVHLDAIRRRDARLRLQSSLGERRSSLNGVETHIRDLSSDPEIALPVGVTKRRLLVQAEARLVRLRRDDAAAAAMLAHLDRAEAMDEALRDAAARGDAVAVRAWCGRGARPEAPDADGASALDLACGTGHAAVVQVCLDFGADAGGDSLGVGALAVVAPTNAQTRAGDPKTRTVAKTESAARLAESMAGAVARPLTLAAARGHLDVLRLLVESAGAGAGAARLVAGVDGKGLTPLHCACDAAEVAAARYLLRCGANVNALDRDGSAPLHYAAGCKKGTSEDIVALVSLLLGHGAATDAYNGAWERPIDAARRAGRRAVIQALHGLDGPRADAEGRGTLEDVLPPGAPRRDAAPPPA